MIALFPCRSPSSSVTFTPTPQPARVRPVRLVRSVVPRLLDQACSREVVGGKGGHAARERIGLGLFTMDPDPAEKIMLKAFSGYGTLLM